MSEAKGPLPGHGPSCGVDACLTCYLEGEVTWLRNAIGDVRGMQSDAATAEEMDNALGRALGGLPPRTDFDAVPF